MTMDEVLRGIEAYGYAQAKLGALILEHGNRLSEREFDKVFAPHFGGELEFFGPVEGHTFILGPNGRHQQWLHLAQLMMAAGLIDAEISDDGLVYYFIPT